MAAQQKAKTKSGCPGGPYMGPVQLAWFRTQLIAMFTEFNEGITRLRDDSSDVESGGDEGDIAARHAAGRAQAATLNMLTNRRKEIEAALGRIEAGEFGYCEETGEEIGLARLKANPLARCALEAQSRREARSKHFAVGGYA